MPVCVHGPCLVVVWVSSASSLVLEVCDFWEYSRSIFRWWKQSDQIAFLDLSFGLCLDSICYSAMGSQSKRWSLLRAWINQKKQLALQQSKQKQTRHLLSPLPLPSGESENPPKHMTRHPRRSVLRFEGFNKRQVRGTASALNILCRALKAHIDNSVDNYFMPAR